MKEAIKKVKKTLNKIGRFLLWLPGLMLITFLVFFALLQIPSVQTKLIRTLTTSISSNTNFNIKLEYVNLTWYDKMLFEQVEIYDPQDSLMLKIEEVKLNVGIFNFLLNKELKIDELLLSDLQINMLKYSDNTEINISQFLRELKDTYIKNNEKKTKLIIDDLELDNGSFSFNDFRKEPIIKGKDYYHFEIDSIQTLIKNFSLFNDTLNLDIAEFRGLDKANQLNIKSLSGKYFFSKKSMSLFDYTLITDHSILNDSLTLYYESTEALKYFNDSVNFIASFNNSVLSSKDIALFAQDIKTLNDDFVLSGVFKGSINRFQGKDVSLKLGKYTKIDGRISLSGLPNINETFIDLDVSNSKIYPLDIIDFIPEEQQSKILNAGMVDFSGHFLGFPNDFVANGSFNTEAGFISSDLNFKVSKGNIPNYSGALVLKNFNLGDILNDSLTFQKINLVGNIRGKGLDKESADFFLKAKVDSIGIKNYVYKNIRTNGEFANQFFEGTITIDDVNLKLDGFATVDLRNDSEKFSIKAAIDTLRLKPLGFVNDIAIATKIDADLKGLHIDSIKGYVDLHDVHFQLDEDKISIDSLKLISYLVEAERLISLETDGLTGEVKGNFKNSLIFNSANEIIEEIKLNLMNDSNDLEKYYTLKKGEELEEFDLEFNLNLWDVNRFIQPFFPAISFSKNILVSGIFNSDLTTRISVNTEIDSIFFKEQLFIDNNLDLEISKFANSKKILASVFVDSKEQEWNSKTLTENFYFESIWSGNHIELVTNLEQTKQQNKANIRTSIDFLKDSISFSFLNSNIDFLDKSWNLNLDNRVIYTDSSLSFNNVAIEIDNQSIALNGKISANPADKLRLDLSNFELNNFKPILPIGISGTVEGSAVINYLGQDILIESNIEVDKLYIAEHLVGDVICKSSWENQNERLNMSIETLRNKSKIIDISGFFYPKNIDDQLDMVVNFENANLNIAQPFLKSQFDNISGYANGIFNISGMLSNPVLLGRGNVTNGGITVKYLNTNYKFDGNLTFQENEIGVQNLVLKDVEGDQAVFNGGVFHDDFKNFVLDLNGVFSNFKMLNTTSVDNNLYYGTAYASGSINFLGTIKNLQINVKAKSEKNTKIYIPIGTLNSNELEDKEYINFVDLSSPELIGRFEKNIEDEINLKGVKLDFDLEVTNDAYVELIFDVTAGDIIRGRGNGNLNLKIDTNGDFHMFGDYQIESGGYNFTLYNIINKEFEIQKGSQISWYGDPYGAILNIQAKYRQLASLAPLIIDYDNNLSTSTEIRKVYPSVVDLGIKGNLLLPEIEFNIDVEDFPNSYVLSNGISVPLQTIVSGFKTKLAQNEQEMKRQVFSLVILKKFSPENSFSVNSNTIGNSLSEFVSNQLSYWATQVDENLEIDVNLAGLDTDAFNTFQLRLSYTFLDGRLRVTRGGGFSSEEKDQGTSSVIGDWTVEYLLTPDGRFRAKMYSRTNLNATNTQLGENNTETGFSLQFVRSFDELRRIITDNRNQNKEKDISEPENTEVLLPESVNKKNNSLKREY